MKTRLLALLLAVLPVSLWADALQDGNQAFAAGDFAGAARAYETALAGGNASAGLYYNLGMAQMKDGQKPAAAVSFRRAIMLDPQMTDARMALSEIERSQGVPARKPAWTDAVVEKAPLTPIIVVGCVLAWIGAFLLLFGVFKKGSRVAPIVAALVLLAAGLFTGIAAYAMDPRVAERNTAVLAENVSLLSNPADQSPVVTKLPASAAVKVLRRSGEWTYCETFAGEKGWAPSKSLSGVVPQV